MKGTHIVLAVLLAAGTAACAAADVTAPAQTVCSVGTLTGPYGTQHNGYTTPGTVWSSVGLATFDGHGKVTEQQSVSINGVMSTVAPQTSSYLLNADCTGTIVDASGATAATFVVVHSGEEVIGIHLTTGGSMTVHYERITGQCTNAMLKGDYGFQRNGQTGPGATLVALGFITFDGAGNQFVGQTIDRSGTITSVANLVGTYAINADCTGTQSDPGTGKVISQIVVVHGGDEVLGISTTAGNNIVIHYERTK